MKVGGARLTSGIVSAAFAAAALAGACAEPELAETVPTEPVPAQPPAGHAPPLLPLDAADFAPSQVRLEAGSKRTGDELADVARCEPCHTEVVRAWRSSAHAFASFQNPLYRVSIESFREARGAEASRFCGGCHDPALLVDGAMDAEVQPDDPRARAGVTCSVCHTAVEVRPGGNAAYTLAAEPLEIPDFADEASIARHKRQVTPEPLRTAALCGSCHKAFLGEHTGHPHFISGADDMLPWKRSAYAGSSAERVDDPIAKAACRDCHMPLEEPRDYDAAADDGALASHRFAGAHTLLAAMRGDDEQLEATRAELVGAASLDVGAARRDDGTPLLPEEISPEPDERLELDLVVKNVGAGHLFPGGTVDIADTWLEVVVLSADDTVIATAGTEHEEGGGDPTAHRLRAELIDEHGLPVRAHEVERFRAVAYNHAVPAREAAAVTYAFVVPALAALPLRVEAKLRHRARTPELAAAACKAQQTERGRAFQRGSGLDACVTPPIVDVAATTVVLGSGSAGLDAAKLAARLADHGQAMLRAMQEETDQARPSLERALALARASGAPPAEARALWLLGELESRQGRVDESMRRFDAADALVPGHPAIAAGRGRALAQVWRFAEAAPYFEAAAAGAPSDDTIWAYLAMARASAGEPSRALAAAIKGLAQSPRNADLLRSQALALRRLGPDDPTTRLADEAHLRHRAADEAPALRAACGTQVPGCALERRPVHVHRMRQRPLTP